jgi:hypothetical protein
MCVSKPESVATSARRVDDALETMRLVENCYRADAGR